MGYTKIVQFGDVLEIYSYNKEHHVQKHKRVIRRARRITSSGDSTQVIRRDSSLKRARVAFYRLVASNITREKTLTFITLTSFEKISITKAYKALGYFYKGLKKHYGEIVAISVPEWQEKSDNIHFHCLIWGIPTEEVEKERNRRFLQGLWCRGYLDARIAKKKSLGIAGYMAKYMQKALSDKRLRNRRAYSSTHNVHRPVSYGSNSLASYAPEIVGRYHVLDIEKNYATMYLGNCLYKKYNIIKNDSTP